MWNWPQLTSLRNGWQDIPFVKNYLKFILILGSTTKVKMIKSGIQVSRLSQDKTMSQVCLKTMSQDCLKTMSQDCLKTRPCLKSVSRQDHVSRLSQDKTMSRDCLKIRPCLETVSTQDHVSRLSQDKTMSRDLTSLVTVMTHLLGFTVS